jgi:hypothetical protein
MRRRWSSGAGVTRLLGRLGAYAVNTPNVLGAWDHVICMVRCVKGEEQGIVL